MALSIMTLKMMYRKEMAKAAYEETKRRFSRICYELIRMGVEVSLFSWDSPYGSDPCITTQLDGIYYDFSYTRSGSSTHQLLISAAPRGGSHPEEAVVRLDGVPWREAAQSVYQSVQLMRRGVLL